MNWIIGISIVAVLALAFLVWCCLKVVADSERRFHDEHKDGLSL